jgi:hypothetical protein
MKTSMEILLIFFTLLILTSCTPQNKTGVQAFDLKNIAVHNSVTPGKSKIFQADVLRLSAEDGHEGIVIWEKGDEQNWSKGNYLVFEVYGENEFSGVINIDFYKETKDRVSEKIVQQSGEISVNDKEKPWISTTMGIMPKMKTQVVFPLSYLDAQNLFVPRSPRQLKGTFSGNRLDKENIKKVVLRFGPYYSPHFLPEFEIASVSIYDSIPEPYSAIDEPVIDKFGQWKQKEWEGKIKDENDLVTKTYDLEKSLASVSYPEEWSRFGGWKEKRFNATGYFRTQHDGRRWWLVDPEGYAFLSTGVDCIREYSSGPTKGIEDLFEWLPGDVDSAFSEAYDKAGREKYMDFYVANLIRVYGKQWQKKKNMVTAGLMKKFRFNTVGNWSNIEFAKANQVPYVLPMEDFPSTKVLLYRDFPDVFSEEYLKNSKKFAAQLTEYKNDPYLVGYFLQNEPIWAFGYHNLAYEMFGTNQQSQTKDEFIRWIADKYNSSINAFNKVWNLTLKSFDDLETSTFREYPSKTADKDFFEFSTVMVKKYVDIPCDEVEKVDNNHLNLGMRYAWLSSDLLYKAGERFDVFSINGYGINTPPTDEIARISGKPVMIGEFHHGAVDRALPATGIVGVLTQQDRANAYRSYVEQGFARPELVGMHYFQWVDQPFYGRYDGENYNIGIVNGCNLPYEELTRAMTLSNQQVYRIASGQTEPFKANVLKIPPISY